MFRSRAEAVAGRFPLISKLPLILAASVVALLALSAALGCRKSAGHGGGLEVRAREVRYSDTCARLVPLEFAPSYPLPAVVNGARIYRVLFYSLRTTDSPSGRIVEARPPAVVGRFDPDSEDQGACETYTPRGSVEVKASLGPRWSDDVHRMTSAQFEQQRRELFASLEAAAAAFFSKAIDPKASIVAQDFLDRFEAMSEPGLRPYYRSLSPDFWLWIQDRTSKTF